MIRVSPPPNAVASQQRAYFKRVRWKQLVRPSLIRGEHDHVLKPVDPVLRPDSPGSVCTKRGRFIVEKPAPASEVRSHTRARSLANT